MILIISLFFLWGIRVAKSEMWQNRQENVFSQSDYGAGPRRVLALPRAVALPEDRHGHVANRTMGVSQLLN